MVEVIYIITAFNDYDTLKSMSSYVVAVSECEFPEEIFCLVKCVLFIDSLVVLHMFK